MGTWGVTGMARTLQGAGTQRPTPPPPSLLSLPLSPSLANAISAPGCYFTRGRGGGGVSRRPLHMQMGTVPPVLPGRISFRGTIRTGRTELGAWTSWRGDPRWGHHFVLRLLKW